MLAIIAFMKEIIVSLRISAEDYLTVYQGQVKDVVATAEDGRIVRFPATILKSMVGHEGIYGTFKINFDTNNKFDGITRLR
jgi:hypothetical protein